MDARALALGPIDTRTHPLAQYGRNDGDPSRQRKGIEAMSNSNWVFGRICETDEGLIENEGEDARGGVEVASFRLAPSNESDPPNLNHILPFSSLSNTSISLPFLVIVLTLPSVVIVLVLDLDIPQVGASQFSLNPHNQNPLKKNDKPIHFVNIVPLAQSCVQRRDACS